MSKIIQAIINILHPGKVIPVVLDNGNELPFRQTVAKSSGNTVWGILNTKGTALVGFYGRNVSTAVVGNKLPTHVTVAGTKVELTPGKGTSGNAKVSGSAKVNLDGKEMAFSIRVNQIDNGYNVSGSIHGVSTGSGSKARAGSL